MPDERQVENRLSLSPEIRGAAKDLPGFSYGVKHVVERWGRESGYEDYVSNGAAIEVVRRLGWPIAVPEETRGESKRLSRLPTT
jgi:hypothetical protein